MIPGSPSPELLEPDKVEARTQQIGRELVAEARRAHAHFSVLNRWTEEVLSWCIGDASVKRAVLQLVDVLPSLHSAREVARHVREYFPTTAARLPVPLRLGASLARPGLLTAPAVSAMVRQLVERVAKQFIAESRPEHIRHVIRALAATGATCTLDILGEQVLSEAEADHYAAQYDTMLQETIAAYAALPPAQRPASCGPRANVSVKPTALTPRFDPVCFDDSVRRATARLVPIVQRAARDGALVHVDMEQYELHDLTVELVRQTAEHLGANRGPSLGLVVQAYLRDADALAEDLLSWLTTRQLRLVVRLVKGAYWDFETTLAAQRHWPVPVYQDKADSDAAFERLTRRLLAAHPTVITAIASHNIRSIAHAMAVAEELDLAKDQIEFQLLYGMGEAIHAAIAARGYPVRIYTPIGELIPGMGYLVRRLLENTANDSFLRKDFISTPRPENLLAPPRPAGGLRATGLRHDAGWQGEPPADFAAAEQRQRMAQAVEDVRGAAPVRVPLVIGGAAVDAPCEQSVRNPGQPEQVLGYVAYADADRAVDVAAQQQPAWGATGVRERIASLRRAAALMRQERSLLAAWEVCEVGKTWREADADVVEAIDYLEYYSDQMELLEQGRPLAQVPGERNSYQYIPRGVAVVIAPWNFPLAIPTGMVSAALVTGNVVIFKPAEQSSIVGSHLARLLHRAGVPPGVLQFVPGNGEVIGPELVRHPAVAQILFTGSRAVGLGIIAATSGVAQGQRHVKHVVTEMGGKNAIIVDADADLDAAIAGTVASAFGYGGQKCSAASRVIVHALIADRFAARLAAATDRLVIGDPADPRVDFGPLIDAAARERLQQAAATAAQVGQIIYRYPDTRLPQRGYYVGPVIVGGIDPQHALARDELFGPLVCVFRARTFDDALVLANDTDYALTGGVYSRSPAHLAQAREQFDVGNLYLNRPITGAIVARQPFGGHRLSGLGTKAGGPDYLLQFMLPKSICEDTRRHGMPLE
jgi:RHH-type proline utilization regulon transcriptional repressor/proline dehydrogenase/delta 1-pyrroline-5-carboxylate dehydrogenase